MENMGFDDAVEEVPTDESKLTIYRSGSTANKVPRVRFVMGKRRIGVLEKGDGHLWVLLVSIMQPACPCPETYQASDLPIDMG